jgi:microcystin-dependent protein
VEQRGARRGGGHPAAGSIAHGRARVAAGAGGDGAINAGAATPVGGSQPHENTQPFLCINFIISLFGIFPSQT